MGADVARLGEVEHARGQRPALGEIPLQRLHDVALELQVLVVPHLPVGPVDRCWQIGHLHGPRRVGPVDALVDDAGLARPGMRRPQDPGARLPVAAEHRSVAARVREVDAAAEPDVAPRRAHDHDLLVVRGREQAGRAHVEGDDAERRRVRRRGAELLHQPLVLRPDDLGGEEVVLDVRREVSRLLALAHPGRVPEHQPHLDAGLHQLQHEADRRLVERGLGRAAPRIRPPRVRGREVAQAVEAPVGDVDVPVDPLAVDERRALLRLGDDRLEVVGHRRHRLHAEQHLHGAVLVPGFAARRLAGGDRGPVAPRAAVAVGGRRRGAGPVEKPPRAHACGSGDGSVRGVSDDMQPLQSPAPAGGNTPIEGNP